MVKALQRTPLSLMALKVMNLLKLATQDLEAKDRIGVSNVAIVRKDHNKQNQIH
jgi:hypothetical protein